MNKFRLKLENAVADKYSINFMEALLYLGYRTRNISLKDNTYKSMLKHNTFFSVYRKIYKAVVVVFEHRQNVIPYKKNKALDDELEKKLKRMRLNATNNGKRVLKEIRKYYKRNK